MPRSSGKRLTAADIMQTDVVVVDSEDSLQDAMELMVENHITGLPVLGRGSRCVGMISATDILGYEQDHAEFAADANSETAQYFDPEQQRWESLRVGTFALEQFAELPVGEIMTRQLIHVTPDVPVRQVAKKMVDEEVHRMLVVDKEQQLVGIVSSFDFVKLAAE